MGFDQTRNASRPEKWGFDPFRDEGRSICHLDARPQRAVLRSRNQTLVAVDQLRREASIGIGLVGALVQSHAILSVRRCGRFEA